MYPQDIEKGEPYDPTVLECQKPPANRAFVIASNNMDSLWRNYGVKISSSSWPNFTGPEWNLTYNYKITGRQFGLQRAPELLHLVSGGYQAEFNWLNKTASSNETEI